ncbi:MAG: hypothetical protein IJI14_20945 [Anaerolineaceae bacterium]|nr:hypothetical protein [Anaerolineaceae bacterium]
MKTEPKKKTQTPTGSEKQDDSREIGITGFVGIVLLAGALFNIPAILKTPETTADKMMLAIVLAMALGGAVLLLFGRKK